jgi:3-hydroxyacyl-[acyl-carrier-protein] dehydratase
MPPPLLFDPSQLDFGKVVCDLDRIRACNSQRFEMEQLTAVVHVDRAQDLIAGYKDVGPDEFWIRGHMPGYPLMPGVLMIEAAAQLCSFYVCEYNIVPKGDFIGFSGLENVRFRGQVKPGDRLVLICKGLKFHRRAVIFACQAFIGSTMVFHGEVHGVPMTQGLKAPQATQEA